ncbi:hypothetical protein [Desulfobacter vibrioformis]|uniref:hypothetical protein n=1 Tax=Desulfobacter vibrioformis TaxID=34031 RepID=UPI00055618B1|nr:hypothetical protein [Desulfobacter vibrioformis]
MKELDALLNDWKDNDNQTRKAFSELVDHLKSLADTTLEFVSRPGVSYSLRPRHAAQAKRPLFAMVDVIDDDPDDRWLSVCFYGELVTDPQEAGDLVPEGLLGEDGYCFDMYEYDEQEVAYLKDRLTEAHGNAPE